ncbi:nutritionally-regulated adipose and cardiac enriched protein homolog isoform X1 [Struthio camelus]|uniref:nutritionally-regulated adipose and cardiac enriched protein homolog isoform X1 n=2 Tax=Struthio camelus TaxID=8801 RepID=UPI003603EA18
MTFPYQKLRSGIPKITAVKCLQDAPGRGFPESFTRPAAVSWLQHEEKPSITPMHRKEKTDDSSCPPSILRKRPPVDQAVGEKRKAERRVRFREPEEVIEHAISCCDYVVVHDRSSSGLPVFLWLSFCVVLILAVSLYYTSMKQDFKVLEEFQSRLVFFFLQIRHIAQKCWTWFTRQ